MRENLLNIFGWIKELVIEIILIPFRIWLKVPEPIRNGAYILLLVLAIIILIKAYMNRNKWRYLDH